MSLASHSTLQQTQSESGVRMAFILLLSFICCFCSGEPVSSCEYKAVGEKVVIELLDEELKVDHHLIWTHNQTRVYNQKGSKVGVKRFEIDHNGSLILENVQMNSSGEYKGEVYNSSGNFIKRTERHLCVVEPIPEPSVMVRCAEEEVLLTCRVRSNTEMLVSWMKNGEKANSTHEVLHVNRSQLKPEDVFSCTVRDKLSRTSADVQPECPDTGLEVTNTNEKTNKDVDSRNNDENITDDASERTFLFGLDFWWMLVILTAGGSFLVLLVICVVCVCRWRSRSRRKAKKEEEYRLAPLMPDVSNEPDMQYMQQSEPQRPSKGKRPLPPLPNHHHPL